ncbi:MAG: FeoB-associated Cys-rich membrane protein [Anaerotignum sp.]|nr:FeoB-associated Cys-rich membrane protein [Anaerotignum sp.]
MLTMDNTVIVTKIIPAIMIFCLVFFNIRKMQKQAQAMRKNHSCENGCAGCANHASCHLPEKETDKTE